MGKRREPTVAERLEVVRAHQKGVSAESVAKLYGVHRQSVRREAIAGVTASEKIGRGILHGCKI